MWKLGRLNLPACSPIILLAALVQTWAQPETDPQPKKSDVPAWVQRPAETYSNLFLTKSQIIGVGWARRRKNLNSLLLAHGDLAKECAFARIVASLHTALPELFVTAEGDTPEGSKRAEIIQSLLPPLLKDRDSWGAPDGRLFKAAFIAQKDLSRVLQGMASRYRKAHVHPAFAQALETAANKLFKGILVMPSPENPFTSDQTDLGFPDWIYDIRRHEGQSSSMALWGVGGVSDRLLKEKAAGVAATFAVQDIEAQIPRQSGDDGSSDKPASPTPILAGVVTPGPAYRTPAGTVFVLSSLPQDRILATLKEEAERTPETRNQRLVDTLKSALKVLETRRSAK